jgi:integrase/recombinase XerD
VTPGRSVLGSDAFWPITSSSSAISPATRRRATATASSCCCRLSALRSTNLWTAWTLKISPRHALVTLRGKRDRIRQCPLWPRTEDALRKLSQGRANGDPVFLSRHRERYTRFGVYRLVERCAARVPALATRAISPHVVRHTSACHLLQAGVDLNTIRAWLGHVSLDTTNIYAEIDLQMKAKAMALCDAGDAAPNRPWKEDKGVIAFLNSI